ncbi:MAG: SIMPL domain-containing protein [Planctomycetes bacterium]|nr:SIMPL domain-containing protein [Planctomycetota bacterium]
MRSTAVLIVLLLATWLAAQDLGSRGAAGPLLGTPEPPEAETIGGFIEIRGSAELRLPPTEARLVARLTSSGESVAHCTAAQRQRVDAVRAALLALGVAETDLHLDFLALEPAHEWQLEEGSGGTAVIERPIGWRMRENLHVRVRRFELVPAIRSAALEAGATSWVAFDYDTPQLDDAKTEALRQALAAAQAKAELLCGGAFGERRPAPLNVRELVQVHAPHTLYRTLPTPGSTSSGAWRFHQRELPQIAAERDPETYYHGFDRDVDRRGGTLPMEPEISVAATVWLYFRPPSRG